MGNNGIVTTAGMTNNRAASLSDPLNPRLPGRRGGKEPPRRHGVGPLDEVSIFLAGGASALALKQAVLTHGEERRAVQKH